jgi:hypothetical protein
MTNPDTDDRLMAAIRALIRAEMAETRYLGRYDYTIVAATFTTASATPTDASSGMPAVANAPLLSLQGLTNEPTPGTACIVDFLDGNPAKPVVTSLASGTLPIARLGDSVVAGPFVGVITGPGNLMVLG